MKIDELKKVLPKPQGYRVLIALPPESDTVGEKKLIFVTEEQKRREQTASITGYVMAVGPDAYMDMAKFPSGPWCREGDWVIFKSYSGVRFKMKGQEFRLINDDTVEAVVEDPRIIERAF